MSGHLKAAVKPPALEPGKTGEPVSGPHSGHGGHEGRCCWYLCWGSNRTLREHLEPILLINSSAALLTLTTKQLHIQVVDRFYMSAFQRTFWEGIDYTLSTADPLAEPLMTIAKPATSATHANPTAANTSAAINQAVVAPTLFEATVEVGVIHDILSGTTPSTMQLLRQAGAQASVLAGTRPSTTARIKTSSTTEQESEMEDDTKRRTTAAVSSSGTRGRRTTAAGPSNKEEKCAWRLVSGAERPTTTAPGATVQTVQTLPSSLEVKVRFVLPQASAPAQGMTPFAQQDHTGANVACDRNGSWPPLQHSAWTFANVDAAATSPLLGASTQLGQLTIGTPIATAPPVAPAVSLVVRTSEWEKVPTIGLVPFITPVLELGPCFPPRYYRFDHASRWLNPVPGARVSMRCASDLQDDFVQMSPFRETCELQIVDSYMQIMARTRKCKKGNALRYSAGEGAPTSAAGGDAARKDAKDAKDVKTEKKSKAPAKKGAKTSAGKAKSSGSRREVATPTPATPHTAPVQSKGGKGSAAAAAAATGKTKKSAKVAPLSASTARTESESTSTSTSTTTTTTAAPLVARRAPQNMPRYFVDHIERTGALASGGSPPRVVRCEFPLRTWRVMHKLVGASSRIEWLVHQAPTPTSGTQSTQTLSTSARQPSVRTQLSGPVVCILYQGTLAAERQVGLIMSYRTTAPKKPLA